MRTIFAGFIISVFLVASAAHGAAKVEECLGCHDTYKGVVHGSVSCNDCHSDITELPHNEKLKKPVCQTCHREAQAAYGKSVHQQKGLGCKECHAVHQITRERKYCASCHPSVAHNTLPAKATHLAELQCAACHSAIAASEVEIDVTLPPGTPVKKENFDRNGDGRIDLKEWTFVDAYLEQNFKGHYRVSKRFNVRSDVHAVAAKPVPCDRCHVERKVFGKALLKRIGPVLYDLPVDAARFVPEIPSISRYAETVHGKNGVACADCHIATEKVSDNICTKCHEEIFTLYKHTPHGTKNAARCTDCHNPHHIKGYKDLNAQERVAVCARCHKDYVRKHLWLPNTALHFLYLECTICHSPDSQKSMVFQFGRKGPAGESLLTHDELIRVLPRGADVRKAIDTNGDGTVTSEELANFLLDLRQKLGNDLYIDGSIMVTKVYHNFTVTRRHEKECTACHSRDAPFYDSMYVVLPAREGLNVYIPAKETILSALPIATAINMTILGEEKIRLEDLKRLFGAGSGQRSAFTQEIGLKWVDFAGLTLAALIIVFVGLHALLRKVTRR